MISALDDVRVKDVMSEIVIIVGGEDTIHNALVLMAQYSVTVLPVVDKQNRCIGLLSTSDLIDPARELEEELQDVERTFQQGHVARLLLESLGQRKVSELMTAAVVTVDGDMPIMEATGEMLQHRVHHLPVVDAQHKIQGIVSTIDLLSAFHRCHADEPM